MNELVQLEKEKLASAGERNVDGVGEGIPVMKSLPIIWQRLVTAEEDVRSLRCHVSGDAAGRQ